MDAARLLGTNRNLKLPCTHCGTLIAIFCISLVALMHLEFEKEVHKVSAGKSRGHVSWAYTFFTTTMAEHMLCDPNTVESFTYISWFK